MSAGWVESLDQAADGVAPEGAGVMVRGEKALCHRAASDAQGCNERDPVGVTPGVGGRVDHEGADRVVAAEVSPDLLPD